jgi:membrane protease YdiL (CAAX protease family)
MSNPEIVPSAPATPPAAPAPPRYTIFRGPNGIRAGWRVLIFLAIVAAIFAGIGLAVGIIYALRHHGGRPRGSFGISGLTPAGLSLSEGSMFLVTAVAALIMTRIERRKFAQYGLPARRAFGKDFWIGTLVGFVSISGCLLAMFLLHGFQVTGLAIHGSTLVGATAGWGATFILVGLAEEFSFRGYLQYTLTTGIGFWPAAILMSLLFGLAHRGNPGETWFGLASVVLFGLLFCLFLRRRGTLWWAVGFHAGWDWGQTFFYGVPDSGLSPYHNLLNSSFNGPRWLTGGTVGPEASVVTPMVLAIVAILFALAYRENRYGIHDPAVAPQTSALSPQTSP